MAQQYYWDKFYLHKCHYTLQEKFHGILLDNLAHTPQSENQWKDLDLWTRQKPDKRNNSTIE